MTEERNKLIDIFLFLDKDVLKDIVLSSMNGDTNTISVGGISEKLVIEPYTWVREYTPKKIDGMVIAIGKISK